MDPNVNDMFFKAFEHMGYQLISDLYYLDPQTTYVFKADIITLYIEQQGTARHIAITLMGHEFHLESSWGTRRSVNYHIPIKQLANTVWRMFCSSL